MKLFFRSLIAGIAVWVVPGIGNAQMTEHSAPGGGVPQAVSLLDILKSGGVVMYPLAGLSVIALALVISYIFTMRRSGISTERYLQTAEALLRKNDYLGLIAISHRHNEAVARIMSRTLEFLTKNPTAPLSEARDIALTEGTREASRLNQRITYLADIGAIAPMLGLFGTVLGMIRSFSVVASDLAATRPMLLAEGVAEALVSTAAGLCVGIPAMAAYSFFRGRSQNLIAELEAATTHLMALLSSTAGKEGGEKTS